MEHHTGRARAIGIDEQEIVMAVEIGKSIRKGAAARMDQYISTAFKAG